MLIPDPGQHRAEVVPRRRGVHERREQYALLPSDIRPRSSRPQYSNIKDGYVPAIRRPGRLGPAAATSQPTSTSASTGEPLVGNELSVDLDPRTPDADTLTYEWFRDGETIDYATGSTYTLVEADAGNHLAVFSDRDQGRLLGRRGLGLRLRRRHHRWNLHGCARRAHLRRPGGGNELLATVEATTPETEDVTYQRLRRRQRHPDDATRRVVPGPAARRRHRDQRARDHQRERFRRLQPRRSAPPVPATEVRG